MQKGDITRVYITETQEQSFSVTSSPVLTLTDPTGAAGSGSSAAATPGVTASLTQVLQALGAFPLAGPYTFSWTFTDGTQTWVRSQQRFSFYNNVAQRVRNRMQRPITLLGDVFLETEYNSIWNIFKQNFPACPTYNAIATTDQIYLEEGLSILCALRLRRFTARTTPVGEISGYKVQQTEYTFNNAPTNHTTLDADHQWMLDAYEQLQKVSFVASVYATQKAAFHVFTVSGPTRNRIKTRPDSLFGIVASLLTDDYNFSQSTVSDFSEVFIS